VRRMGGLSFSGWLLGGGSDESKVGLERTAGVVER
jgi:hypothetical protein